jgi:hypothetical protein
MKGAAWANADQASTGEANRIAARRDRPPAVLERRAAFALEPRPPIARIGISSQILPAGSIRATADFFPGIKSAWKSAIP